MQINKQIPTQPKTDLQLFTKAASSFSNHLPELTDILKSGITTSKGHLTVKAVADGLMIYGDLPMWERRAKVYGFRHIVIGREKVSCMLIITGSYRESYFEQDWSECEPEYEYPLQQLGFSATDFTESGYHDTILEIIDSLVKTVKNEF